MTYRCKYKTRKVKQSLFIKDSSPDYYCLFRSNLIMGVHPGCHVCSIVAASLVAVETDVGETMSTAKVAFMCGLWSVRIVALLSAGPSSCFCINQLLFPCLEVMVQGAFPRHAAGCNVPSTDTSGKKVKQIEVTLLKSVNEVSDECKSSRNPQK